MKYRAYFALVETELAAMLKTKKNITEGPIFSSIFLFAVPLMLTGILQLVYNMADHIVVGQFSGDPTALAAVGSTASLTNLIMNLILGIGGGVAVVIAQFYGAQDDRRVSRGVHTAMTVSLIMGVAFGAIGLIISEPALTLMGTKPEVLDGAVLYFRIICIGIPAQAIYNFGAAVLRAIGDTKTSLIILTCTGIVNVIFNLIFVIGFNMSVDGVATATVIAQYLSAISVFTILVLRRSESYGFSLKKYAFDARIFGRILRFGVPAGIQSSMFSISNILLTAAANTFETAAVTAKAIAGNIDGVTYTCMNCYFHASMTFAAQNYGAKKPDRIKRAFKYSLIQVVTVGITVAVIEFLLREQLASLFIDAADPNKNLIIAYVEQIMFSILLPYFLCGIQEVMAGALRGLGFSLLPMITSLIGVCGMRVLWILFIFPLEPFNTIGGLMLCYPVTWIIVICAFLVQIYFGWKKKLTPLYEAETADEEAPAEV